jgi:hypothetical protein
MGEPTIDTTDLDVTLRPWWPPHFATNRLLLAEVKASDLPAALRERLRPQLGNLLDEMPDLPIQLGEAVCRHCFVGELHSYTARRTVPIAIVAALTRARAADLAEEARKAGERQIGADFQEALVAGPVHGVPG